MKILPDKYQSNTYIKTIYKNSINLLPSLKVLNKNNNVKKENITKKYNNNNNKIIINKNTHEF
jgi:hypothetical protein